METLGILNSWHFGLSVGFRALDGRINAMQRPATTSGGQLEGLLAANANFRDRATKNLSTAFLPRSRRQQSRRQAFHSSRFAFSQLGLARRGCIDGSVVADLEDVRAY